MLQWIAAAWSAHPGNTDISGVFGAQHPRRFGLCFSANHGGQVSQKCSPDLPRLLVFGGAWLSLMQQQVLALLACPLPEDLRGWQLRLGDSISYFAKLTHSPHATHCRARYQAQGHRCWGLGLQGTCCLLWCSRTRPAKQEYGCLEAPRPGCCLAALCGWLSGWPPADSAGAALRCHLLLQESAGEVQ